MGPQAGGSSAADVAARASTDKDHILSGTIPCNNPRSVCSPVESAREVAAEAALQAIKYDVDGVFPTGGVGALHRSGLLDAPFASDMGSGKHSISEPGSLSAVLTTIGRGSLALGRLYEGHVNAVALTVRYGSRANLDLLAEEASAGRPSGVWMAGESLRLERVGGETFVLRGRKILCSGAGHLRRPLVAAEHEGGSVMVIPLVDSRDRVDVSQWTAHGMRATATGSVDFDGVAVGANEIVGVAGDYLRSPYFRGGAWRVLAVQLGGVEAIIDAYAAQLRESPHRDHPLQLARYAETEIACETARLWVEKAARTAEGRFEDAEAVDAYVDLARNAFEGAALKVVALAQKAIGLKSFLRPNPLERLIRDLTTYLRQPNLDMSLMSAAAFHLRSGRDAS